MKVSIPNWLILVLVLAGCENQTGYIDVIPPAPPQGITTVTGDQNVELHWVPNTEPDLAGYNVYVSDRYAGRYDAVGTSRIPEFAHFGVANGVTYYYAVTAFDLDGNESELSHDVVYDTPRPEGHGVVLRDYRLYPTQSGYDFSTYSVGPYDDYFTDVFFEYSVGVAFMNVWEDTDIQDMGYTRSFDEITAAPIEGWLPSKYAQLVEGHTYVVWTWDNHYAKFRVTSLSPTRLVFDWAYQVAVGNPELMLGAPRSDRKDKRRTQGLRD